MALSLALLTGGTWVLLALAGLACRRRLRWDLWDALRGVRPFPGLPDESRSLAALALLGDGYRQGLLAQAAGNERAARSLARAETVSARCVASQLAADLDEFIDQGRVLQDGVDPGPAPMGEVSAGWLRCVFRAELAVRRGQGGLARLNLRLWSVRLATALLTRRGVQTGDRDTAAALDAASRLADDVRALTHAVLAWRAVLSAR